MSDDPKPLNRDPYEKEQTHPLGELSEAERLAEALLAINRTLSDQGSANRKEERREDTGNKWLQGLTLLFVILTTVGIFWQASIFNDQLIEARKVFSPIQEQAGAAKRAAEAAAKQSESSEKALIGSQRAWVGPQNVIFNTEPTVGKAIELTIQYQNSGRTPAVSFIYFATPFPSTLQEDSKGILATTIANYMDACKSYREWSGGSVVYPTTGFNSYNLSLKTSDDFVDEAIAKGDKLVVVQGCFLYRSFDTARHSYFCYFYRQGISKIQNLSICPTGHYAD